MILVVDVVAQLVAPLVAGGVALVAARRVPEAARAWKLIAAGSVAWAFGNTMWIGSELLGETSSAFPSLADAGFLALLPLAIVGVLSHPAAPRGRAAMARILLDGLIAGGSVRFLAWSAVLVSVHRSDGPNPFESVTGLMYAVGDFVIVTVAALVAMRAPRGRRMSLLTVAAGFGFLGVADGFFTYLVNQGTYETGHPIDALWVVAFLLVALGAWFDTRRPELVSSAATHDEGQVWALIPYALVFPALVVGVIDGADGRVHPWLLWNGVAVVALLLVRQVVDRVQNVRLVASLRQTVDDLRRRDLQLAEAQRLAHLGHWDWEAATDTATWSDEVFRILGLRRGEVEPSIQAYLDRIHPDDRGRVRPVVEQALVGSEPFEFEHRVVGADGRVIQCRARVERDESGRIARLSGTAQDITTVRRLAKELERRLAELERSNADLAHFASVASHDLAAPVQLLLGHLRLLHERNGTDADASSTELIEGAIRGAQRLEELIQDILAYSLATASEEDLRSPVDLARVVREAARTVGADNWGARVEVHGLPVVEAHPGQMRQLFQNLLSNALKFVPGDRAPHVRVSGEATDTGWCFSVSDNGIGVPEFDRSRIFHMFERGESRDVRGTGIGLAICARIVARHGGHLWVEPSPDGGSVFRFTLATSAPARMIGRSVRV